MYFSVHNDIYTSDIFPTKKRIHIGSFNTSYMRQFTRQFLQKVLRSNNMDLDIQESIIYVYHLDPKIIKKLKNSIKEHFAQILIDDIEIKPQSIIKKHSGKLSVDLTSLDKPRGSLTAYINGAKTSFAYVISGKQYVLHAKKLIRAGSIITKDNTYSKQEQITSRFYRPVKFGLEARMTIAKDGIITPNKLKEPFDVKKGAMVKASIKDGALTAQFPLRALQNGYITDEIKLQNSNKKIFLGIITGKNTVEIR